MLLDYKLSFCERRAITRIGQGTGNASITNMFISNILSASAIDNQSVNYWIISPPTNIKYIDLRVFSAQLVNPVPRWNPQSEHLALSWLDIEYLKNNITRGVQNDGTRCSIGVCSSNVVGWDKASETGSPVLSKSVE